MRDLEQDVLDLLRKVEDPISLNTIMHRLGFASEDRSMLRSFLKDLVRQGHIVKSGSRYWCFDGKKQAKRIKQEKTRKIGKRIGRLSVNSKGHGFISFESGGPDWYVAPSDLNQAKHGDWVVVEKVSGFRFGKTNARVTEIERMGRTTLVGVIDFEWGQPSFHPIGQPSVAWKELKGLPKKLEPEQVLCFRRQSDGTYKFEKILGSFENPEVDEALVLAEQDIQTEFNKDVLEWTKSLPQDFQFELGQRTDFRHEHVFTIDGQDARDFDDAIHIKYLGNEIELGIHIADVSHFVESGSVLDQWAAQAGNSTYLPHKAFPMLPEILSTGLCSLNPDCDRYTMSLVVRLNKAGKVLGYQLSKGLIRSKARLTYDQVYRACVLDEPEVQEEIKDSLDSLNECLKLAERLRKNRVQAGGLNMASSESKILLTEGMALKEVTWVEQNEAHQMIEAFMVLANEVVAEHMFELGIGIPFRHHGDPHPMRISQLFDFLSTRGFQIEVPDATGLNQVLAQIQDKPEPERSVYQVAVLRCLKLAEYTPLRGDHFGLASERYCHFTSPIRRYADLLLHQRLTAVLANPKLGPEDFDDSELQVRCSHISRTERASSRAEQNFAQLKLLRFLKLHLGETFDGVISDVQGFGIFVKLSDLGAEGLIKEEGLGHERFEFNPEVLCWTGKRSGKVYALGDHLQVRVDRIDLLRRECDLSLAKLALDMPHGRRRSSGGPRSKHPAEKKRHRGRRQKK